MPVNPIGDEKPTLVERGSYIWPETEIKYPRVSKVLDVMEKKALLPWAVKKTAEMAVYQKEAWQTLPDSQALKMLKDARWESSGKAADAGTAIHGLIPNLVGTKNITKEVEEYENAIFNGDIEVDEELMGKLLSALAWLKKHAKKVVDQEVSVFRDETEMASGWAGTADAIIETHKWKLCMVDWKSGTNLYREVGLQMAAYALSDWVAVFDPEEGTYSKGEVPKVNNFVGVHLTDNEAISYVVHWNDGTKKADKVRERLTRCVEGCANILSYQNADPWYFARLTTPNT